MRYEYNKIPINIIFNLIWLEIILSGTRSLYNSILVFHQNQKQFNSACVFAKVMLK